MSNDVENRIASLEPSGPRNAGNGLVVAALVLPVIAGVALCFVTTLKLALIISAAMVIGTAIMLSVDAARLGKTDRNGRPRESIGVLLLGMLLMWIAVYPFVIFRRRTFTAPNLTIPAILITIFFVGCPFIRYWFIPATLPSCSSEEVAQLLEGLIRKSPLGQITQAIDGYREISYDPTADIRQGECVAHTTDGDVPVSFYVEWHDHNKRLFGVRIPPANLPSCTSAGVVKLVEQAIQTIPLGKITQSIDGHRELSYDPIADVRYGQCVAHTNQGDVVVNFSVRWRDHNQGMCEVRISPAELPSCTSEDVVKLLERVIRETSWGEKARLIDGHREISYDATAEQRQGQCVAHLIEKDLTIFFIVQWRDRDKGQIEVRAMPVVQAN